MLKPIQKVTLLILNKELQIGGIEFYVTSGPPDVILSSWVSFLIVHGVIVDPILTRPICTYILPLAYFEMHVFVILAESTFLTALVEIVNNSFAREIL